MGYFKLSRMKFSVLVAGGIAVLSPSLHAATASDTVSSPTQASATSVDPIDYVNAIPMALPSVPAGARFLGSASLAPAFLGKPSFTPGSVGSGQESPVRLAPTGLKPASIQPTGAETPGAVQPAEFGSTAEYPFTTSRVNMNGNPISKTYPYRAAGKLFFKIGSSSYVCSASLIKPGIVVTAAHCVAGFGTGSYYSDWTFVPAYNDGAAPYGAWKAKTARVMTSYLDGTDSCAVSGIVCTNDVALITLAAQDKPTYAGHSTGWLAYGTNGFGFTPSNKAQFTQLGYPVSHDAGNLMQRTESQAYVDSGMSNNSVWGSRQTGGSSGGPEVVNLGQSSQLSGGVKYGTESVFNVVVGVTSWGYTDQAEKIQGGSPFLSTNIGAMLSASCSADPSACN